MNQDSRNILFVSLSIIIAGIIIAGAILISKNNNILPPPPPSGNDQNNNPEPIVRKDVSEDDDPIIGDKNAPITMIEFSDFECPFCKRFFDESLSQIEKNYIEKGYVKLVYRDFPLTNIHPNAQKAAEAAECADEQGKWRAMHDIIFKNQQSGLSIDNFKKWAKEIKLDAKKFDECLNSDKYKAEVEKDLNDGLSYGVQGTPSFFINGELLVGAQPYQIFKSKFDSILKEKGITTKESN